MIQISISVLHLSILENVVHLKNHLIVSVDYIPFSCLLLFGSFPSDVFHALFLKKRVFVLNIEKEQISVE